jgi:hypothetical protein
LTVADEITSKVLRSIRDGIAALDVKIDSFRDETNKRMDGLDQRVMVMEHILRDVHGYVLILNRRVTKLEKRTG